MGQVPTKLRSLIKPQTIGCEWVIDAYDCHPARLRELHTLRGLCDSVIRDLELRVVGEPMWHQFPGEAGVTGLYLLSESHLACHTYPEFAKATFNLYCCRSIPEWPWVQMLQQAVGSLSCEILHIPRGTHRDASRAESVADTAGLWNRSAAAQEPMS